MPLSGLRSVPHYTQARAAARAVFERARRIKWAVCSAALDLLLHTE
jgi:hypothetical protein